MPQQRRIAARACDQCRQRKARCDGAAPACGRCAKHDYDCSWRLPVGKRGPRPRDHETTAVQTPSHHREQASPWQSPASTSRSAPNALQQRDDVADIWTSLLQTLQPRLEQDAEHFFRKCIDAYMQHLFPITPIVYERAMQGIVAQLFIRGIAHEDRSSLEPDQMRNETVVNKWHSLAMSDHAAELSNGYLPAERAISLLLALCAQVCSLVPASVFPVGQSVRAEIFAASKDMLRLYRDRDIERPCALSVIVRYFHCSCFHAAGNTRVSWLVLGEAVRLALEMQVFDENSLLGLSPLERQLRRAVFWQLSTGDQSSSILNSRPLCFQRLNFDTAPSTLLVQDALLRDPLKPCNDADFEHRLGHGFGLIAQLFDAATDVLTDLRFLEHTSSVQISSQELDQGLRKVLREHLLRFQSTLDTAPDWLKYPWQYTAELLAEDLDYQRHCFEIQAVNLRLTFHTMKLILLQKAADIGIADALGFSNDTILLAIQKTEIANELVNTIRRAPFEAIQLNGESCVEKIRQVGAIMLQISQSLATEAVATRAKACFDTILDILTRLDSKAPEALYNGLMT